MAEYLESPESDRTRQLVSEDGLVAGRLTELCIRVWSIDPELVTWSSEHAVICLMADLVTASGGQLIPESRQTLVAQFDRQETAVGVARRLQRALQAFTEGPETAGFAASIAIRRAEDQVESEATLGVSGSLWSHSVPGQIMVSGAVYETLQFAPGLQFHGLSADSQSPDPRYQELLWTDAETLAAWQERVDTASRLLQMEESHRQPEIDAVVDAVGEEPIGDDVLVDRAAGSQVDEFQIATDIAPRKNRLWFGAGATGLALVAVVGAVLYLNGRKAQHLPPQPPKTERIEPQPNPQAVIPAIPENPPEKQPETVTKGTRSKRPDSRVLPKTQKVTPKPEPAVADAVTDYEGFSARQIPQLLRRAEDDAGAGNYAERQAGI